MCSNCPSTTEACPDQLKNKPECRNTKGYALKIIDDLLPQSFQWITWTVIPHLYAMGQLLSKKLPTYGESLYEKKKILLLRNPLFLKSVLVFLFAFYVGTPLWFYFCPWLRRAAVFMHFVDWPFQTFSHPEYYGLNCTRHFFVNTSPGVYLGAWHITPCQNGYTSSFEVDDQPVILYLHGSAESRSAAYRRSMYKVLSREPLNAHVITFDYRGFGDSTYVSPTVKTIEEDATAMFQWLKQRVDLSRIIIWGHSMGTGIAIRLGETLAQKNEANPLAIVLEASFASVSETTKTFPLSFFHRHLPFFEILCSARTDHPDTNINSLERVGRVSAPLLILHAEDDSMVWSVQGRSLWTRAVEERPRHLHRPVYVELDKKYGCGHRNIHRAPTLPYEVERFLKGIKKHADTTLEE